MPSAESMPGVVPEAHAIVSIWERGRREHPVDRALTILAELSRRPRSELARLSLERRDRLILAWRARLFSADLLSGAALVGWAECPDCGCGVEVSITPTHTAELDDQVVLEVAGTPIAARMPTSADLAAAAACPDVESARALLVRRALDSAGADDANSDPTRTEVTALAARSEVIAALEAELGRRAEISAARAELCCPDCASRWSIEIDAAAFLWRELEVLAARLLREVDVLAQRYGWSESEILGLHADRRRFYLELAS